MKKIDRNLVHAAVMLGVLAPSLLFPARSLAASAPTATTLTVSNVTATSATLNGTINPGSATTIAWIEWGPGNALKFSTARTNVGSGAVPLTFTAPIAGLTAGVTYRCRAVASNSLGIIRGLVLPFGVPAVALNGDALMTNDYNTPFVDPGAAATANPAALAVGDGFTAVLKASGKVVAWGDDSYGQTDVTNAATNSVAVAAGYVHCLAVRPNGTVLGWGQNGYGQLTFPPAATNVVAVAAGFAHSIALRKDGNVVAWGSDDYGQVTIPPGATNVVAIAASYTHSLALRADGSIVEWGEFADGPQSSPTAATNVVAIGTGYSHSLALRANGTVLVWGSGAPAVGVVPASVTNVVAVAGGFAHSLALRADGTVIGWGYNNYGETNVPPSATNIIAIGAGFGFSQALRADGVVIGWGLSTSNRTVTPTNLIAQLPVTTTGTVNVAAFGTYPLLYSATNVFGFAGTAARSVVVPGLAGLSIGTPTVLSNGSFQLGLIYNPGVAITVLASTNLSLPPSNWTVLGQATEDATGHYLFTDPAAGNYPRRFYQVRTP